MPQAPGNGRPPGSGGSEMSCSCVNRPWGALLPQVADDVGVGRAQLVVAAEQFAHARHSWMTKPLPSHLASKGWNGARLVELGPWVLAHRRRAQRQRIERETLERLHGFPLRRSGY